MEEEAKKNIGNIVQMTNFLICWMQWKTKLKKKCMKIHGKIREKEKLKEKFNLKILKSFCGNYKIEIIWLKED